MKSRLKHTVLNSVISLVSQGGSLVLKFVAQTYFIFIFGSQYLGINSLFSNIMLFLAIFEFGMSSAMVYALYKPLAEQNTDLVAALVRLFRKTYIWLACLSGVIGIIIFGLIPLAIPADQLVNNWQIAYGLVLVNYLLFFLNEDQRQLLTADQMGYVSIANQGLILLVQVLLQVGSLYLWHNYIIFLAIQLGCTLVGNWLIRLQTSRRFKYLKTATKIKIPTNLIVEIKQSVKGLIWSKISTVLAASKEGILIVILVGVTTGGIYSNYAMLVTGVTVILTQVIGAAISSIGNLVATSKHTKDDQARFQSIFWLHYFINFACTLVCSVLLFTLLNPFINWWVGAKYELPLSVVLIIVLNFAANQMRQTNILFINAMGLFFQMGIKSIGEIIVSLVSSVGLVVFAHQGITGVLLGTLISHFGVNLWWEALLVLQNDLADLKLKFLRKSIEYWGAIGISLFAGNRLAQVWQLNGIMGLVLLGIIAALASLLILMILFKKTTEYHSFKQLVSNLIWKIRLNFTGENEA